MKLKLVISGLAIALALAFSAPAKAQYHNDEACNSSELSYNGALDSQAGSGPNGEKVIRFSIDFHYTASDSDSVRRKLPTVFMNAMNEYAASKGYKSRFIATDFTTPKDLNLTDYMDIYSNADGTYTIFTYVNGWGVGHLFKFRSTSPSADAGDAFVDAITGLTDRIATGWTCGGQK
jgi:hypothetical protein